MGVEVELSDEVETGLAATLVVVGADEALATGLGLEHAAMMSASSSPLILFRSLPLIQSGAGC